MRRSLLVSLLSFALPLSAAITGTVVGPDGAPVAKARVTAYRSEPLIAMVRRLNSGAAHTPLAAATTDAAGAFKLEAGTGLVDLTIEAEGLAPQSMLVPADEQAVSIDMRKAELFNLTVTANGKPVEGVRVLGGSQYSVHELGKSDAAGHVRVSEATDGLLFVHPDFTPGASPVLDRGIAVHGKVLDEHERPVANAAVIADGLSLAMTAADGTFALPHVRRGARMQVESDRAGASAIAGSAELVVHLKPMLKIGGVVRDESKNPLAGVTLFVTNASQWMELAVSDAKGAFTLNTPGGNYWLMTVSGPYFERTAVNVASGATQDITLKRLVTIDGIVRDDEGKPVAGARVSFAPEPPRELEETVSSHGDGVATTADGRFRVHVAAGTRGHFVATNPSMPAGVTDSMTVAAGGAHDVVVTMQRGIEVKGTVTDGHGHPLAGVAIRRPDDVSHSLERTNDDAWATTAADGSFGVRLASGAGALIFAKKGYVEATEEFDVTPEIHPLSVAMSAASTVRGKIVNKDGTPADAVPVGSDLGTFAMAKADGTFELDFPAPGTYTIEAGFKSRKFVVTAPSNDVRLVLDSGLTIRGHVTDAATGAPVEQFTSSAERGGSVVPDDEGAAQGDAGDFVIEGLDPGPVTVVVAAPHYLAARVNAEAGQSQAVAVALSRGLTLRGRVHDAAGAPIEGVSVSRGGGEADAPLSAADGTFELDGVAPDGTITLTFSKARWINREQKVHVTSDVAPIDVVLTPGLTIKGHVVDGAGKPVPEVAVNASTATYGGSYLTASTDAAGAFEMAGAVSGYYDFTAGGEGSATKGSLHDVDVEHVRDVTIRIERHPSGTIEGRIAGMKATAFMSMLDVKTADGSMSGNVRPDGTFRIQDVPAGMAKVQATLADTAGARRTRSVSVDVTAGAVAHVELRLDEPRTLRGRVTHNGQPVAHADVVLIGNGYSDGYGSAHATTGADGAYEMRADPGVYHVTVEGLAYRGDVDVEHTAVFDIDFTGAFIRALVVDATSGQPIEGAEVTVIDSEWKDTTKGDGRAAIEVPHGAKVALLASKAGYANAATEAAEGEVVMKLVRSEGAVVRIVDARDGRTLAGYAVARDAAGHVIASAHQPDAGGTSSLAVPPGEYRFSASAEGYGSETMRAAVPSGEIRIALPRGGKLLLRSNQDVHGTARLLLPDGDVYVRCWCSGIAEIALDGRTTTVEAVSPGSYTLEVTPSGGKAQRFPVTVIQGETVPVQID